MNKAVAEKLIGIVLRQRPDWSRRKAAEWLKPRLPRLRRMIEKAARDVITEEMLEQELLDAESRPW